MALVSVVLPTYNERETIASVLADLLGVADRESIPVELIVVDDGSPDGTAADVGGRFGDEPRVRLHRRNGRGLAGAIRTGAEMARGDILVLMDTDGNHNPAQVPELLRRLEGADIVVGSRYVRGGDMPTSRFRYWCSFLFSRWARWTLRLPVTDCLSGFLCWRRQLLADMPVDAIFVGYGDYAIRLLFWASRRGLRLVEIPTVYGLRRGGESKTSFVSVLWGYSRTVVALRSSAWRNR